MAVHSAAQRSTVRRSAVMAAQGNTRFGLPPKALAAFNAAREAWVEELPKEFRLAITAMPKPHITLVTGCNGDGDKCRAAVRRAADALCITTMKAEFAAEARLGDDQPVAFCLLEAPSLVRLFHAVYDDKEFNPLGASAPHCLHPRYCTEETRLGYAAHATLAWFKPGTDLSELPLAVDSMPAFELAPDDVEFEALGRPGHTVERDASGDESKDGTA